MSPADVWPSRGSSNTPAGENCAPLVLLTICISRAGSTLVAAWNLMLSRLWRRAWLLLTLCNWPLPGTQRK